MVKAGVPLVPASHVAHAHHLHGWCPPLSLSAETPDSVGSWSQPLMLDVARCRHIRDQLVTNRPPSCKGGLMSQDEDRVGEGGIAHWSLVADQPLMTAWSTSCFDEHDAPRSVAQPMVPWHP